MSQRMNQTVQRTEPSRNGEQFPKGEGVTTSTTERRVKITPQCARMLLQAEAAVKAAQGRFNTVAGAALAVLGIDVAELVRIEDGDPPVLVFRVPGNGTKPQS